MKAKYNLQVIYMYLTSSDSVEFPGEKVSFEINLDAVKFLLTLKGKHFAKSFLTYRVRLIQENRVGRFY